MIATSLALALGVSVASATAPTIKYGKNGTTSDLSTLNIDSGLLWNQSGGGSDGFYTLRPNSGSGEPVNIAFTFSTSSPSTASGALSTGTYTVTMGGAVTTTDLPVLQLQSLTNGIDMQGKTLTFDFGGAANTGTKNKSARKMILDLTGATNYQAEGSDAARATSLIGNITLIAGRAGGSGGWFGENQFEAIFGGDMIGNITLTNNGNRIDMTSKFTFNSGASLQGSITNGTSNNEMIFKNGNIIGNVTAQADYSGEYGRGVNTITFKGEGNKIQGDVIAKNGTKDKAKAGENTIIFEKDGSITGNITNDKELALGTNTITFNQNGSINTMTAYYSSTYGESGTNTVIFKSTGTLAGEIKAEGGTNTITATGEITAGENINITASGGHSGSNSLTFDQKSGTVSLGKVLADGNSNSSNTNTIITSQANVNLTLAELIAGPQVGQNDYAKKDSNTINTKGLLTITTNGIQTSNGGSNTITAKSIAFGDGKNDISAGWKATNTITITGESQTFGSLTANGPSDSTNIITINSGALTVSSMSASDHGINTIKIGKSATINGNIATSGSAQNNFTLTADNSTLTLKGSTSQITTLTALSGASNGNTLTLDTATNKSVEASVATLTNGEKLKVEFKGAEGKSTKLSINTNTNGNRSLKSISVTSGTNNTLALGGTNTMTITDQVMVRGSKGIIFDLSSGSSITFTSNLKTQANGITTFNLGGTSNTITGTLTNNGTHNFNISSSSATLKYNNGLAFSSGINNINFNANGNSTLNWQGTDNTAKNITTSDTATTNINLADSVNATITSTSKISTSTGSTNINFNGTSSLAVASVENTGAGSTNINFNGTSGTLTGKVTTSAGTTNINIANGASGEIAGNVTTSAGTTNIVFASGSNASSLKLNKSSGTYTISTLTANGADNKLELAQGKATISNKVNMTQGTGITFDLATDTELALSTGADSRLSAGERKGAITLKLQDSATATISGSATTNITNLDFTGSSAQTLNVKNSSISFGTITANNANGSNLKLDASANAVSATLYTITGDNLFVELAGTDATNKATLNLNGGVIKSVSVTNGDASANIINFNSGTTTITDAINNTSVASSKGLALNLNGGNVVLNNNIDTTSSGGTVNVNIGRNSTLSLKGNANIISSLSGNGKVDLAMADSEGNPLTRSVKSRNFKTLNITNYSGNNTFNLYVNPKESSTKADKIEIGSGSGSASGSAVFTVTGNIDDILGITYEEKGNNNVQIASGMTNVNVSGGDSLIGYDIIRTQVIKKDNGDVYLGQAISKGVAQEVKDVANSALTVNYDLYLANFNSLNKRMGELRDNPYNQGVWARVFGGAMSNDFGAGSKTNYVTAQAGYDYSLTLSNARNYMGVAIAYGHSTTKSNTLDIQNGAGASIALQDVNSNMVEVGIYNSFVMDSGWYNDTIFKFDYIMSSFTMTDNLSLQSKTNNFAMVLSDEFGYRYKFGSEKSWYIDPQVEVGFGYFNQSDFNRAMLATNSTLKASQDSIFTLRTRAGMSLGKKFSTQKGFASLYVGAFYEYDYIEGGNADVLSKSGIANPLDKVESNGRAVVNVGSNIELTDGVRMYIDVEKSFGDKQRTFMQFNFGARYSFGEKTLSAQSKTNSAPLKIENQTSQEQSEQTSSKEENTQANSQEQNTSSKE